MKRKVFKNIVCILSIVFLISMFFVFYGNKIGESDKSFFPNMLPFFMMSVVLSIFSLYWSYRENQKFNTINYLVIFLTLFINCLYIVIEALYVTAFNNSTYSSFLKNSSLILFIASCIFLVFDLIYAMFLDFRNIKK